MGNQKIEPSLAVCKRSDITCCIVALALGSFSFCIVVGNQAWQYLGTIRVTRPTLPGVGIGNTCKAGIGSGASHM